jgi:CRISPR/Cas system-associated exonuclease Cas4 (RecB family)
MNLPTPEQLPGEFYEQPLTARMLDDFATCPRKFLLSFFATRKEERHFRGGPAALHRAVRQALVATYKLGGPGEVALEDLLGTFEQHWEGSLCADAVEEEQLHEQGLQMLRDYYEAHRTDEAEIVATDLRLTGRVGDQEFVAVADVVRSPGPERVEVYRFVTSRRPLGEAELAADISAQLLWLLAREHFAAPRVLYYALRQNRAREVVLSPDEEEYLRRDLASRAARIRREREFSPRQGRYCRWCRSRAKCPVWRR